MDDAQAARSEMAAAQADTTLFPRRFVACMAFLIRVGTTIDDEAKGRKFRAWWKAIAADPLHVYMRDTRHAELKRGESTRTAQHQAALAGQLGFAGSLTATRRPASRAVGPGQVAQNIQREQPTRVPPRVFNVTTSWLFARGAYAGQDVVPLIDQYVAQLVTVLRQAEALTD